MAQLVEQRSPKPQVGGSSPSWPANNLRDLKIKDIMGILKKSFIFLTEVKAEIHKITWTSREDIIGTTIIVCLLTLVFAAILGGMDVFFSFFIKKIIV